MAYKWLGMKKISWKEVQELHEKGELAGCYRLYDDDTEGQIEADYSWDEIIAHHEQGGEFGYEMDAVELNLPDGKKITAPIVVDISSLGSLDEIEYELWNVIQEYMMLFGIRTEDDEPDWATVKTVQDKIIEVFMDAGVDFKILTDEQTAEMKKKISVSTNNAGIREEKICGTCRCNYMEVEDGMILRHYCNNPCSDSYQRDICHTGGCSHWEGKK